MNKDQAIVAMMEGKKVTHRYFGPDEWVSMENGSILLTSGIKCPPKEFWKHRSAHCWNNGYKLFKQ
jgi:hypothetical protein